MKRVSFALSATVIAGFLATIPGQPAQAVTTSAHMLVTFQDNGTGCSATNSSVVVVNANVPAGQTATQVANLGKPSGMVGVLNEAKPFANNTKVVALWARNSAGHGGVGVFTRTSGYSGSWTQPVTFNPSALGGIDFGTNGGAHSVTVLRDNYYAVAHVGTVPGWSGAGHVVVFSPTGAIVDHETVESAHGVEWDAKRNLLFAVGHKYVQSFALESDYKITHQTTWEFPGAQTTTPWGHDIRHRRSSADYFVTTDANVYNFHPETSGQAAFTPVTMTGGGGGGAIPEGGVKTVDEGFDNLVEYGQWKVNKFFFTDGRKITGPSCMLPYKQRWVFPTNTPVMPYDQPESPTPPPPVGSADPFIYNQEMLRANATPDAMGETIWAGFASWASTSGVRGEIRKQMCAEPPKTPYILFYHWGDGNTDPEHPEWHVPKMEHVETQATQADVDKWVGFAHEIATGIDQYAAECGTSERAYIVVEPEWDSDVVGAACSWQFESGFQRVVNEFTTYVPDTVLVNSPGLYKRESDYACFDKANLFEQHGFSMMEVNGTEPCTRRHDGSHYNSNNYALTDVDIVQDIRNAAGKLKRIFPAASNVLLSDLAVTSCGWGKNGQASIFQDLSDGLANLYDTVGLRGVVIRDAGPGDAKDRFTGDANEVGFAWTSTDAAGIAIASGKTQIQNHLNTMGSNPVTPQVDSTVEAAPANLAPGATTHLVTTIAAHDAISNAIVDLEIYNGATQVFQDHWDGVTMAAGTTRDFPRDWTPATAGTYTVKVGVFSAGWSTQYDWNNAARTITVSTTNPDPSFTSSATASPSTVGTGSATTITATVNNVGGALSNGVVELEVYSPGGAPVDATSFTGQNIGANGSQTYPWTWTAPAAAGTYTIRVRVTGASGSPQYHHNTSAGSVSVTSSRFTSTATVSRATVAPGNTTTITATVTNVGSSLTNGDVAIEIYDKNGVRVAQAPWTGQNIASSTSATYTYTWTAPATTGTYTVKIGVWGTGWTPTLHWNNAAATIGVTAPSFVVDASSSPSKVAPGGTTTITVTVTTQGGTLENAVVDLEVYNSLGSRLLQQGWTGQTLTNGTTTTLTHNWTVPTTTGTYTVKAGVMGPGWTPTYKWNDSADTITVAAPSFTSIATTSAASVTPGQAVTLTATWTATGGAVTNSRFQLVVDKPDGSRQFAVDWVHALADGQSVTHTHVWTTPTTPTGTYRVRLGVFSNNWAITQHWNNSAATVSVGGSFQPTFQVGDGANNWWIEVYTSTDVTQVDAIGKNGAFYLTLVKKPWGAWAATAPQAVNSGDLVQFIARRSSDGASAGSSNFAWLAASPITDPGYAGTFTIGSGASTTWVEVAVSPTATSVEVKVNNGSFTALTYSAVSGKWGRAMVVTTGSKVVFRSTRSDGARAYSTFYNWLQ